MASSAAAGSERGPADRGRQFLLPHIKTVLYDQYRLEECVNEINGLKSGLIRVGTFNSVSAQWLPGMIKRFQADYPGIRFELLHGTNDQNVEWIATGRVDIAFIKYPPDTEMDAEFLYRDPIVGIFAADDPCASWDKFPLAKLPELPYIALNEGVEDEITDILQANQVEPNTRFVESDDHAVIAGRAGTRNQPVSKLCCSAFPAISPPYLWSRLPGGIWASAAKTETVCQLRQRPLFSAQRNG